MSNGFSQANCWCSINSLKSVVLMMSSVFYIHFADTSTESSEIWYNPDVDLTNTFWNYSNSYLANKLSNLNTVTKIPTSFKVK